MFLLDGSTKNPQNEQLFHRISKRDTQHDMIQSGRFVGLGEDPSTFLRRDTDMKTCRYLGYNVYLI